MHMVMMFCGLLFRFRIVSLYGFILHAPQSDALCT